MSEPRIRRRARLKQKEALALRDQVAAALGGATLWEESAAVETAELGETGVFLVDNQLHGLVDPDAGPFLTVRGLLAYRPERRWVTVDMGAVRFVHNGADVMAPGITEVDPELQEGSWCWVRDERNRQPLAVGRCLVPPGTMPRGRGKAVASVHHLGDRIWNLTD